MSVTLERESNCNALMSMRPHHRLIGLISQILLLQWILLGSGLLCARHELMTAHAMDVAHSMTGAAGGAYRCDVAGEAACQTGQAPSSNCGAMMSCASVATPALQLAVVAVYESPADAVTMLVDEPASRSSQPEPPPPRV